MNERKMRIAGRFDAAAAGYDAHSPLQLKAALRLAARVEYLALPSAPRVLEIGCGSGHLTRALLPLLRGDWIVSDIAPAMVGACRQAVGGEARKKHAGPPQVFLGPPGEERREAALSGGVHFVVMDGEKPALAPERFDLIVASLAAQWFADLPTALAALAALLAPGGCIALATLGRGTFAEWREAHAALGLVAATPAYPDAAELAQAFPAHLDVEVDEDSFVEPLAEPLEFLRGLRRIGADTPAPGTQPLSAGQLRRVLREHAGHAGTSYELLYAIGRRSSSTSQPRTTR